MSLWIPPTVKKITHITVAAGLIAWLITGLLHTKYLLEGIWDLQDTSYPYFMVLVMDFDNPTPDFQPSGTFLEYLYLISSHYAFTVLLLFIPTYLLWWLYSGKRFEISPRLLAAFFFLIIAAWLTGSIFQNHFMKWQLAPVEIWKHGLWCLSSDEGGCNLGYCYGNITAALITYVFIPLYLLWRGVGGRVMS